MEAPRLASLPRSMSQRKKTKVPTFNKMTLLDMPVSNNGARVRMLIYLKGLEDEIDIMSPEVVGGLKSDEYAVLNPQCKMPVMVLPDGMSLPESEVIVNYLVDKYGEVEPDLMPHSPELRARGQLAIRFHDLYINNIQGCMYKAMDIDSRADMIRSLNEQLDVLEEIVMGPYITGHFMSTADCALFPTFVFMVFILPKYFGWETVFHRRPKLEAWFNLLCSQAVPAKVKAELESGLNGWAANERWDKLGITEQLANKEYKWAF
mmetsp:Transcript_11327/g.20470  ORF Transcript_11327/g.20470 Transcript_11327/m.20470 type:complete len:263 (-) Transcript_11327:218-1006(-)